METLDSLGSALIAVVAASDAMYNENAGEPAATSTAALEVDAYDEPLAAATGTERPLFGAYCDAEAKLRSLNDLVRSYALLLALADVNVGQVVIARAAIETSARMYWGLAIDGDYRERATRWLRERLRSIEEIAKLSSDAREEMERQASASQIKEGAKNAGLGVTGPPPVAIDMLWPLLSAANSLLCIEGLDRETAMLLFYRSPSSPTHGALHGIALHFVDPKSEPSRRATRAAPLEQTLILMAGVLNGYVNAHGALVTLYGWDVSQFNLATATAARQLSAALQAARSGANRRG